MNIKNISAYEGIFFPSRTKENRLYENRIGTEAYINSIEVEVQQQE